jgi:hypothetical protein
MTASGLAHPNALMHFAALLFLMVYYDRQRLGWRAFAVSAAPYLLGAIGFGLYIAKAPDLFVSQIRWNAGNRLPGLATPWLTLKTELTARYLRYLGGFAPDLSALHRLKLVVLLAYFLGIAGSLVLPDLRRLKGFRALMIIAGIDFVYLTFFEGRKSPLYLIHIVPVFVCAFAWWIWRLWTRIPSSRWLVLAGTVTFLVVQFGGTGYVIARDTNGTRYRPVVDYLRRYAGPQDLIMGSAELGYGLGFESNISDDTELGYRTGKRGAFIVVEERYRGFHDWYRRNSPDVYRHIQRLLEEEYQPVFRNSSYTIYRAL